MYFSSEMSIFAFSRNGRASSMKRSIDIWATYWPLSQKHLFRSNAALRRLIFSSSKSFTISSMSILDRKSTRLNSSHSQISYAVFCLKKKRKDEETVVTFRHLEWKELLARLAM